MALASRLLCHAYMLFISCGYSYRTPPPLAMWLLWYSVSELARHSVQCHVGEVCRLFKVHGSQREADSPCRQVRRLARISRRLCRLWRVLVPLARRLLCGACLASVRSSSCCRLPISLAIALPLPLGTCGCVRPSGIVCVRGSVRGGAMGRSDWIKRAWPWPGAWPCAGRDCARRDRDVTTEVEWLRSDHPIGPPPMEHGARRNVGFDDIRGTVLGRAGAALGVWFLVSSGSGKSPLALPL